MLIIIIIIYIILSFFFGPNWVKTMFLEAGCLGKILSSAWVIALVIALLRYIV
jgi:hypothetical protein